mgnify:CR=1 FL=1
MFNTRSESEIFNFEYVWEVYKPVEQRRWGYYTLPVLFGDNLVARLYPRLDRKNSTLQICGFWLEDETSANDIVFANALRNGLQRFATFVVVVSENIILALAVFAYIIMLFANVVNIAKLVNRSNVCR